MKYIAVILAIALGVAAMVAGGIDDSPGVQLLGVLIIIGAVVLGVRMVGAGKPAPARGSHIRLERLIRAAADRSTAQAGREMSG